MSPGRYAADRAPDLPDPVQSWLEQLSKPGRAVVGYPTCSRPTSRRRSNQAAAIGVVTRTSPGS